MAPCIPFLQVRNIAQTIQWYEDIGFTCTATNHTWEPDGELNWARLEWEGAAFMLGPNGGESTPGGRDASLWFNAASIEQTIEKLKSKGISIDIEPATFYEMKVVSWRGARNSNPQLICRGNSYKIIAAELVISINTVRTHIKKMYDKLQVHTQAEAVSKAVNEKLL